MKIFDSSLLQAQAATLQASLFQNQAIGLAPALFFSMTVPLKPIHWDGKQIQPSLSLAFMRLPIRSLKQLDHLDVTFPLNPEDGYIEASLHWNQKEIPADIFRIEFGVQENGKWPLVIHYDLLFELEKTGIENSFSNHLEVSLSPGMLHVDYEVAEAFSNDVTQVHTFLQDFFEVSELSAPVLENDEIYYHFT
ncbi:MAG: hypothetical protein MUF42_15295 [Cytophagaceae bacterium]|jgi:hypothetical protein|nr:hypothetical protein [Cytophagaceae bacterium]